MSLEHGILGYLSMKPLTGYDIKKLFNVSAAFFWPADQAQIYRLLKTLTDDGLVTKREPEGDERRIEYSITEKGQDELRDWLLDGSFSDFVQRSPLTLQLFFSGVLSEEEQLAVLDRHIAMNRVFTQKLKDNYEEHRMDFADTVELEGTDRRLESATYACKWGIMRSEAYDQFLKEIKREIGTKEEAV